MNAKLKKLLTIIFSISMVISCVTMNTKAETQGIDKIDNESISQLVLSNKNETITNQNNLVLNMNSSKKTEVNASKPVEIIFVIDSTGSMGPYINSVRSNLNSFIDYLNEKKLNTRCAVIEYKDITSDGKDSTVIHKVDGDSWFTNADVISNELSNISPDGGGDNPETPTDAFAKIINDEIPLRDDSQKFIFLLTDADFKDNDISSDIESMDECIRLFRRVNMHTTVIGDKSFENRYEPLYKLTGGKFLDINSSDYYKLMIDIADWVYDETLDTDGDGLPDEWELNGVDYDHDGIIDLHLEQMGADPKVKDIFVEVDWMERPRKEINIWNKIKYTKEEEKNLKPSAEAMRIVYQQFKNHNINLHIDAGSDSIDYVTNRRWGRLSGGNKITYVDNFELGEHFENWNHSALNNFTKDRWSVFRYCQFINRFNNDDSSGITESLPGQFFLIADGNGSLRETTNKVAGTFMHELGHTLGLRHGGSDHVQYKPNNLSIMNYLFQFSGLLGDNEVNYSEFVLPALNETALNENDGVDPHSVTRGHNIGTKWYYEKENKILFFNFGISEESGEKIGLAGQKIDFNNNGEIEDNVSVNLNHNEQTELTESVNEWDRLILKGGLIGGYGKDISDDMILITDENYDPEELEELGYDDAKKMGLIGNPDSCIIKYINPIKLYSNVDNQKVYITINNLCSEVSTPKLVVKSDIFDSNFEKELKISGLNDKDGSYVVEIPINKKITKGKHTIECELACDNGKVERATKEIVVEEAKTIKIGIGESKRAELTNLDDPFISWASSDSCVVVDNKGNITGKKDGVAQIIGKTKNNNIVAYIVKVENKEVNPNIDNNLEEDENKDIIDKDNPNTGDTSNTLAYSLCLILSLVFVGSVIKYKKC